MARELRKQEVADAVRTFCELHPELQLSSNEKGFCIMPGDILVYCEEGKLVCNSPEIREKLIEIIVMSADSQTPEVNDSTRCRGTSAVIIPYEPTRGTRTEAKPERPNVPARPRSGQIPPNGTGPSGLTPQDIINYINPKATEQEAYLFCEFCRRKGADPMTKQVYLAIFENEKGRNVSFIAGKEYFTEKAETHPQFDGFEAGIIVRAKEGGELIHREGTFYLPSEETLLGGWASVHRKDRAVPMKSEVVLGEYNTQKNQWAKMPGTMIRKVAIVQALREAFPQNLGGMYDRAEMEQAGTLVLGEEA
jgi:phage recombination protein Bet